MATPFPLEADEGEARELLYEAYNELHALASELGGAAAAPAVVVVGHQTDGKSALVEALMGFQFNHVGGGTKTRRPVALHLRFNPRCDEPQCRLLSATGDAEEHDEAGVAARPMPLADIQAYIEAENLRLENDPCQFSEKEIIIKVEYKHSPNLTIIDTPGLILPAPGRKNRVLQSQASAVESLVRAKIQHKETIILCLEDCSDWSNATTRRVVMQAILSRELEDIASIEDKLGRSLTTMEKDRIGVGNLRLYLEELLQKRYIKSVPLIIPLLEKQHRNTTSKLREISHELSDLDETKLKEKAQLFHDTFLTKLSLLLKGMVVAPPDKFGETLVNERINGGTFTGSENFQLPNKMMPNGGMRLYGGAQYHRAMAEFRLVVGSTRCPPITRDEIVNACGVEDIHDGTNYSRTACVIAVAKARDTFEPFLDQLGFRLLYILKRLIPISVYLLEKDGEHFSSHEVLIRRVQEAFKRFVESTEQSCRQRCMEDLESTTRYVTWSLHNKNRAGLRHFLDSFVAPEQLSVNTLNERFSGLNDNKQDKAKGDSKSNHSPDTNSSTAMPETRLVDLLDSTLWNRRLVPSSERLVYALVHQIFHGIKEHFLVTTELKFNCFLLMPIVDKLPALLRQDLESAFEEELDSIFDVTQLRQSLGQKKRELEIELKRIKRLKEKFGEINKKLNSLQVRQ
ncbi:dynamin-like protein ARC5-like isoform X1 [Zea mays]|uniref:Dynamin-like protein ARC5 n=1 Tax=Zea mays TaxID=4577 RepID=A0A1D6IU89_MAIZE|nr:uncharacterized protein LOC100383294 isoform X1 [Zea mays]AQK39611.1 Dynamin-like protein ARC5 [Zea mays]|eukprot:XP_008662186.1 uncharacterized protein LOC100383294 isoform X1 [Zea mays]